METALFITLGILSSLGVFVLAIARRMRRSPLLTQAESRAKAEVFCQVAYIRDVCAYEAQASKAALEACLKRCEEQLDQIFASYGVQLTARVEKSVDKHLWQTNIKGRAPILGDWKREAAVKRQQIAHDIVKEETLNTEIQQTLHGLLEFVEQEQKDYLVRCAKPISLLALNDDEIILGLARMIADKRRMHIFLGENPLVHAVAKAMFAQAKTPPRRSLFEELRRSTGNINELFTLLNGSPQRIFYSAKQVLGDDAALADDDAVRELGIGEALMDGGLLLAGTLHVWFHVGTEEAKGLALFAMHSLLGDFSIVLETFFTHVWDEIWQALVNEFGDQLAQEFLSVVAEALTVFWLLWRGYRYYKLLKRVRVIWNGDNVLPELRNRVRVACLNLAVDKITQAKQNLRQSADLLQAHIDLTVDRFDEAIEDLKARLVLDAHQPQVIRG